VHKGINQQVNFPKLAYTITGKVLVVSINKADTTIDQNDKTKETITQSYTITSFDAGAYTMPPFEFGSTGGVLKTNELSLQVQTVKVDTTKAIYDIKQPLVVTYGFLDWLKDNWILVLLGFIIIIAIIGFIYYLKTRPKDLAIIQIAKPSLPIHTIAINKLQELRGKKLWQQDVKQYHSELTDIIREYLEKRYDVQTQEATTGEILSALKNRDITSEYRAMLQQMLLIADMVKFAKVNPIPTENERSMDDAIEFVLKTQVIDTPKPITDGGSTDGSV
jgi:ABC-type multidrug transport system fused ATPase/permease subunit